MPIQGLVQTKTHRKLTQQRQPSVRRDHIPRRFQLERKYRLLYHLISPRWFRLPCFSTLYIYLIQQGFSTYFDAKIPSIADLGSLPKIRDWFCANGFFEPFGPKKFPPRGSRARSPAA
jgi:hypothetical protein